jgi:signal transduction histidine kinase/DNA-binding NarL/FixJ family response regulator
VTSFVGRLQERLLLQAALEERAPRLLVVRGPSGVGKTALVEQVLHDMVPADAILGRAKYAEQGTTAGLRPVVDALSQTVDAALGRLYDPAAGAVSLRALLGAQYDALLGAGFAAAGLPGGTASAAVAVPSLAGTVRLVDAMVRVLQWLDGFALPVVLFIDDWHRAPNEAVGFVHACTRRSSTSTLKLVLAARDDGPIAYPDQASVVALAPLASAQQLELLSRLLDDPAKARAVVEWLGDQASGLPFDLAEIALALHREQAFVGHGDSLRIDPVRAATIDHRDINQIIVQRARGLPLPTLRLGVAAALWGDRADLDALGRCLSETPAAAKRAAETLQASGLLRIEGDEIAFPHDRIRASLLQVLDDAALRALAHALSDVLLGAGSGTHRQTALRLKLVGGVDDVRDRGLAGLFAAEASAARLAAQFDLAADFGEAAWSISQRLGTPVGDRIAVLHEACFAAAHRRQAEATRERCALMIAAASTAAELADAYERSVVAIRLVGTVADAWIFCRDGLARFGIHLPERVTRAHLLLAMLGWRLVGRKPRRVVQHDARTELAVASLGNTAGYVVWERSPRHAAYMAIRTATRARLMGYDSALWLSVDAFISSALKNYRAAAEFGDKALAHLPQLTIGRGMTLHRAVAFGTMWRDPRASLIDNNRQIYDFCIAEGDLVGAANAVLNEALWTWRSAPTLEETAARIDEAAAKAERLGDARARTELERLALLVQRLREPESISSRLPEELSSVKSADMPISVIDYLAIAEDWPAILHIANAVRPTRRTLDYNLVGVSWRFYENLARLKMGQPVHPKDLSFIERIARANPTDHLGKLLLLRAERSYRQGEKDCLRAYSEALEAMQKGSSCLETGLAAECAAVAARDLGDTAAYARFRAAAATTWSGWGAFAKLATFKTEQLDVSVRTRLAEAEAQAVLARRGERAKSRFLAEVGHELRTPLQAMQGLLDLAAERPDELNLGAIREVFGSLKSVVDDLTELGALGADAPLNIRVADLAALLGSELGILQETARRKRLTLGADLAALQDTLFAIDADRVRQVVRNLLSNAVKYSETGSIVLSAQTGEALDGRTQIVLAVEDSGPGIPEARLPHVFEPFDRGGRADAQGLGLGLSLSRRIAERMGGSLIAENRAEGGARFTFAFAAERRDGPALPHAPVRPLAILLVEDTAPIRRLLVRLLAIDGHAVTEAGSLAEGREHVARQSFDLVLLDLHLPDGDGLSLLEHWPGGRGSPPVIVLTAAASRDVERRVTAAGAILLRKPIAAADLRAAIATACGSAEPSRPSTGFDAEMARLAQDARHEIAARSAELVDLVRADAPLERIRQHSHKLAGLAAQFDAPHVAAAADRIEHACAGGTSPRPCLEGLERALAGMAGAHRDC